MANAKKLPSGSWRVRVFSHKDSAGKAHYESFTAPSKAEAEMKASQFAAFKSRRIRHDITVGDALDGYIRAKEAVLSPSTTSGYVKMRKLHYAGIEKKKLRTITSEDMQQFVSDLSLRLSPKTVRNVYALLTASFSLYCPDVAFKVTLPAKKKFRPQSPSDEAVKKLYEAAYPRQRICIGLGMLGLREGEIAALTYEDMHDDIIHVNKDIVRNRYGKWVVKETPKTEDGDRYVKLPPYLVELIGTGKGRIVPTTPNTITKQFIKLRTKLDLPGIRFHDLRHYFASTAAVLGIPDTYIADMGGWQRGGSVMKSVYQNNIASMSDYYSKKMADHMENIIKEDA